MYPLPLNPYSRISPIDNTTSHVKKWVVKVGYSMVHSHKISYVNSQATWVKGLLEEWLIMNIRTHHMPVRNNRRNEQTYQSIVICLC